MSKKKKQEPEQKQELCPECGHPVGVHSVVGCTLRIETEGGYRTFCTCDLNRKQLQKLNLLNEMHLALKCASTVNANGPEPTDGGKAWGVTSPFQVKLDDMLSRAEKLLGKLE